MTQLAISTVLTDSARAEAEDMFSGLVPGLSEAALFRDQPRTFADAVFGALAKITMDFAAREPDRIETYQASRFAIIAKLYGHA